MAFRTFLNTTVLPICKRAVNAVDRGWRGVDEVDGDTVRDNPGGRVQAEAGPRQPAVRGVLLVDTAETHCEAPS